MFVPRSVLPLVALLGFLACSGDEGDSLEDRGFTYLFTVLPAAEGELLVTIHHNFEELSDPNAMVYTFNGERLERDSAADPSSVTYQARVGALNPGDEVLVSGAYPGWGTFEVSTRYVGGLMNIRSEPALDAWVPQVQDGERPALLVQWNEDPWINEVSVQAGGAVGIRKSVANASKLLLESSDEGYDAAIGQPSVRQDGHFHIELEPRRVDRARWGHGEVIVSQSGELATLSTQ